jgi:ComF family protein
MLSAQPVQSRFQSTITDARDALLALLYPTRCRVCGADHHALDAGVTCDACWDEAQSKWLAAEHCVKCDARLRSVGQALPARQCPHCRELDFTVARACGAYEAAWLSNILQLKAQPHLPLRMQQLLIATYERHTDLHDCEVILPVPLHAERYVARQFNQAELIAHALARHTGLPVNLVSLVRAKATERHRAGMGIDERAKSLRKAFRVRAPRLIQEKVVLVVDDVMTTGSTAHEIAHTLLAANARAVKVLTLARAIAQYI